MNKTASAAIFRTDYSTDVVATVPAQPGYYLLALLWSDMTPEGSSFVDGFERNPVVAFGIDSAGCAVPIGIDPEYVDEVGAVLTPDGTVSQAGCAMFASVESWFPMAKAQAEEAREACRRRALAKAGMVGSVKS